MGWAILFLCIVALAAFAVSMYVGISVAIGVAAARYAMRWILGIKCKTR